MTEFALVADEDVQLALEWLAYASGDAHAFWKRISDAHDAYRRAVRLPEKRGRDVGLHELGDDVVASYLAQADALGKDRSAYDLTLAAEIVPFIQQLGANIGLLARDTGAAERARRMLSPRVRSINPNSAIFELVAAGRYAEEGFSVEFIPEIPGGDGTPDFRVERGGLEADVECKRLQKGKYETDELIYQRRLFGHVAGMLDELRLSAHIDVTYTQEMKDIPATYLADHLAAARSSPIATLSGYPWKDEFGEGTINAANVDAVRRDIHDSYLLFGTKLARLLTGRQVAPGSYNMTASAKPHADDPRYVDEFYFGSVVTWQCSAEASILARARYVKSKLKEIDKQFHDIVGGIIHFAMDAERDGKAADERRINNRNAITDFRFDNLVIAGYINYFVPRVTEHAAWMIDETVDRFGLADPDILWSGRIFGRSEVLNNDLPAWHQPPPPPPRGRRFDS
jgi:hypothetical protein